MENSSSSNTFSVPGDAGGNGGSPKGLYLYFLLQQCAKHQWTLASTKEDGYVNIERSCLGLITWCPDKNKRQYLFESYQQKKQEYGGETEEAIVSASVFVVGELVDYLNEALQFTDASTVMLA